MKLIDFVLVVAALLVGALWAYSVGRWIEASERGVAEMKVAKEELIRSAGLFELHNRIYSQVGERAWRERVRPEFMGAITRETVLATGDPLPDWRKVVGWVREHPERARELLRAAGERWKE